MSQTKVHMVMSVSRRRVFAASDLLSLVESECFRHAPALSITEGIKGTKLPNKDTL